MHDGMELPLQGHDCVGRSYCFFCGELIALPTPQQPAIRLDNCNLSGRDMAVW